MTNIFRHFFTCNVLFAVALGLSLSTFTHAQLRVSKQMSAELSGSTPVPSTPSPLLTRSAPSHQLRELDAIVAVVNSEPITQSEVRVRMQRMREQLRAQGSTVPSSSQLSQTVLERLIEERALLGVSKDIGLRVSEEQLNNALMGVARQNGLASLKALQTKYEQEGGSWALYKAEMQDEITLQQLREREVEGRVRVSDAEVEAALRERAQSASQKILINVAHILLALPEQPSETQVQTMFAKAQEIQTKASAKDADFAALAKQNSSASDRDRGGELGLRPLDKIPSVFLPTVIKLSAGEVGSVVRSDAGFHVVKVLARQSQALLTVPQSKVRHILLSPNGQMNQEAATKRIGVIRDLIELKQTTFEAAARLYSVDGSAQQGGDLGWSNPGMFVPEFEQTMDTLKIGELSKPVLTQFGVHLIQVTERRDYVLSEAEQKTFIRNQLKEKKAIDATALWISEVRNRAFVEVRESQIPN